MKYIRKFESHISNKELIDSLCSEYDIKNYTINPNGYIDVDGNVDLYGKGLTKLPLKFNKINRWFDCGNNKLTSFEGSPIELNGGFWCENNKLTSFEFSPKIIRGEF